jgi:hypothetical protein
MRKEFNNLVELLSNLQLPSPIGMAIMNLEHKIDEVEKRIECARRSAKEINDSISKYTQRVDDQESFVMTVDSHDSIQNGSNDVLIALDLNEDMCIEDNWYNLFSTKEELKPIAVGRIEYEFPEDVYTIGNSDNTEMIADVYESEFVKLCELGLIWCESDERFPIGEGNKANYVVRNNEFIVIVKNKQIDLTKVPIKNEAPTMLCQDEDKHNAVKDIIAKLKEIEVDGETMEYILDQVGMLDQVAKQLGLVNF